MTQHTYNDLALLRRHLVIEAILGRWLTRVNKETQKQDNAQIYFFSMLSTAGGSMDTAWDDTVIATDSTDFDGFGETGTANASFAFVPFLPFYSMTSKK